METNICYKNETRTEYFEGAVNPHYITIYKRFREDFPLCNAM